MNTQNRFLAAAMILLQLLTATGCTTTRVGGTIVAPINMQKIQTQLAAGVRVKVKTTAGRNIRMKVVSVGAEKIAGVQTGGTAVDLTFDQIDSIEILEISKDRTWALVGGVTLTFIAISVAVLSSIAFFPGGP
jgi:hypothetical protein